MEPPQLKSGTALRALAWKAFGIPRGPPSRPDPAGSWLIGRLSSPNLAEARRIWRLIDRNYVPIDWQLDFKSGYRWSELTPSQKIKYGTVRGADVKVPWELARMQHLPQLAFAASTDPGERGRYSREFRNEILDFIATNPPRFGVNWAMTMDVAIRVANWLIAYDLFRASGATFDEPFQRTLARSVQDHGKHIIENLEWDPTLRGNHYLADVTGLLSVAAWLPRTSVADAWLCFAVGELLAEVDAQFHPDGGNFEASTSYHRLSGELAVYGLALIQGLSEPERSAIANASTAYLPWRVRRLCRTIPAEVLGGSRSIQACRPFGADCRVHDGPHQDRRSDCSDRRQRQRALPQVGGDASRGCWHAREPSGPPPLGRSNPRPCGPRGLRCVRRALGGGREDRASACRRQGGENRAARSHRGDRKEGCRAGRHPISHRRCAGWSANVCD